MCAASPRSSGSEDRDFDRIAARHVKRPDDPYLVLGADRSLSDVALRQHYLRLVQEIHPDREIARGLPPEAVKIATAAPCRRQRRLGSHRRRA